MVPLLSVAILFPTAANIYAEAQKSASVKSVEFIGMEEPKNNNR